MQTMIKISNYKFRINVSLDTYTTKKEATACLSKVGAKTAGKEKMAFIERYVIVDWCLCLAIVAHSYSKFVDIDQNKQ